jgi:hypothetical protein
MFRGSLPLFGPLVPVLIVVVILLAVVVIVFAFFWGLKQGATLVGIIRILQGEVLV